MKLTRICLISLGCVSAAMAFGIVANAAIDLVLPAPKQVAVPAKPAETPAPTFELASATAAPTEIMPVRVKTIVYREEAVAAALPVAVPLPRPRPQTAPGVDAVSSISRQPASMAIAAATRANPDNGDPLGAAGIERMKLALALTAEQEEFWPAIAAELRALGQAMQKTNGKGQKISLDSEAIQRLYWAAAPLITRLSHEQKLKVKQMAHIMGLHQVAEAL
jgi:hypothetical protein